MLVYDCGEMLNGTWKEEVVGELQRKRVTSDEKFYGRELLKGRKNREGSFAPEDDRQGDTRAVGRKFQGSQSVADKPMGYISMPSASHCTEGCQKPVISRCFSPAYVVCWQKDYVVRHHNPWTAPAGSFLGKFLAVAPDGQYT